jgi:hypothetical protein
MPSLNPPFPPSFPCFCFCCCGCCCSEDEGEEEEEPTGPVPFSCSCSCCCFVLASSAAAGTAGCRMEEPPASAVCLFTKRGGEGRGLMSVLRGCLMWAQNVCVSPSNVCNTDTDTFLYTHIHMCVFVCKHIVYMRTADLSPRLYSPR